MEKEGTVNPSIRKLGFCSLGPPEPARSGLTGPDTAPRNPAEPRNSPMKVRNSLRSLRARHRDNRLVRRKGRVYVINKTQKRYKARQG